mmetsp:Transcript_127284/g.249401  ORF Transcript_127284/g.249401 Transcript_127284/m.249401 type:complete len:460 (+) Transcript_127284:277-1656(+)
MRHYPPGDGGRAPLGSAAALLQHSTFHLLVRDGGVGFRESRVDADGVVQLLLGATALEGHGQALDDLARVGPQDVDADHTLVLALVNDELHVAFVTIRASMAVSAPLEGHCDGVIDLHILLPEDFPGLVLAESNRAELQRREHGRGDIGEVHELRRAAEQPPSKKPAGLDGNRGKLRLPVANIANGVNVRHSGLVRFVHRQLPVLLEVVQAGGFDVEQSGAARSADRHEHGVVDAIFLVVHEDAHLAISSLLELVRHHLASELDAVALHIGADLLGHVLVEAAQQDRADHDCDVKAEAGDEAGALERDVGSPDDKRFPRRLLLPEDVVRADAALLSAGVIAVARPAPAGDEAVFEGRFLHIALGILQLDRVRILEGRVGVVVLDILGPEIRLRAPVQRLDVVVDLRHHVRPAVRGLGVPTDSVGVALHFPVQRADVHQFFRDATDIDASTTKTPSRASG